MKESLYAKRNIIPDADPRCGPGVRAKMVGTTKGATRAVVIRGSIDADHGHLAALLYRFPIIGRDRPKDVSDESRDMSKKRNSRHTEVPKSSTSVASITDGRTDQDRGGQTTDGVSAFIRPWSGAER